MQLRRTMMTRALRFAFRAPSVVTGSGIQPASDRALPVKQVPYTAASASSADGIKSAPPPTSSALLSRLASDEAQDVPLHRGARSRKEPSRISAHAVRKSVTRGQPLTSPRPAVTATSLSVNKQLRVGRKLKRFFPTLGTFVAKVSMYNHETDSYHLVYPTDDHEEWLPFFEVVKLLPKSWD